MNVLTYDEIVKSPHSKIVVSKKCPCHTHTFFEFIVCFGGTFENRLNAESQIVKKGDIILVRPQDVHIFENGEGHIHRDIYIFPDKLKKVCDCISPDLFELINSSPKVINFSVSDFDLQLLETGLNLFNNITNFSDLFLNVAHINIITKIFSLWQQYLVKQLTDIPTWIAELLRLLDLETYFIKPINEIIKLTNYSHGHVCREFKKIVGISLNDHLANQKFSFAKSMLSNHDTSIKDISDRLNYSSPSNFIAAFKNYFHITPTQWKNHLNESSRG